MKIAMISYNTFLPGEKNGWKKSENNDILILQGTEMNFLQADRLPDKGMIRKTLRGLAGTINDLNELDLIIIYVGRHGAENSINMMKENNIPASKLIFVMCDCELSSKKELLEECGYSSTSQIISECGGFREMIKIYHNCVES